MKKMICMILSLSMLFAACVAHADVLTEWGIPKEIAQRVSVEQPISWDGTINQVRELLKENDPQAKDSGWIASFDEVYYDGVSAYVLYTIREIGATESIGTLEEDGKYWLDGEDEHYVSNRGVGWHEDCLVINGQKVIMPVTDEAYYGSEEPGVVKHYMKIRLDQAKRALPKDDPDALALPIPYGQVKTLGLPIGDDMPLNRSDMHFEEMEAYKAANQIEDSGYLFANLNTPEIEIKTFDVNRKIGNSTIGSVETIVTPVRLYINVTLTPDEAAVAAQHEKDKAIPNWENVPKDFSAGTVNNEWAFAVTLVDADGNEMEDMCKGYATGVIGVGANVAMYEYNLQVNNENGHPTPELPEQLYLAVVADDGTIDMTTAVQVL